MKRLVALAIFTALLGITATPLAQDRLRGMPGYDQFQKMQQAAQQNPIVSGAVSQIQWAADGLAVSYMLAGRRQQFDLKTMSVSAEPIAPAAATGPAPGRGAGTPPPAAAAGAGRSGGMEQSQTEMAEGRFAGCPSGAAARGRQQDCIVSPDGKLKAFYRARNLWIANFDGSGEKQITTDGSEKARLKYGTASWVYGEELSQTTAIWWSPDSRRVGFYRFDESKVQDFYVQMNQTGVQDSIDVEAYPKAGAANPVADVLVYDVAGGKSTTIDIRDGKPFDNSVVGHYVYAVQWSKDGTELLMNRTNRRQQILEFVACQPSTGKCRVVLREEWLTGWINTDPIGPTSPLPRWLNDGKRFIWESERNGWKNFYLYDLTGKLIAPLTTATTYETGAIVKIDEVNNLLFYTARDGDNYLKMQLHRVGLDGRNDVRLTNPAFNHAIAGNCTAAPAGCAISRDNRYVIDIYQTHDQPPATQMLDATTGKVLAQIAKSDTTQYDRAGFKRTEQFSYLAADGQTRLFGQVSFPSNFDPSKKYPTLVAVYGGPILQNTIPAENFVGPCITCEYGFLQVLVGYRGVFGTGKRAADALYMHLGMAEMDDMALGIKALWNRPYFDKDRVGIYGTSYGGYTAATMILRYPDVIAAASSSSPATSWVHYDSIYTERYMWIPQENKAGYDAGSDMTYVNNLNGRLLLYYGTADNNVHQNNSMQLIRALQQAGKSFELQVGPDQPHTGVNFSRMLEFFIENLVMYPERLRVR